MSDEEFLARTPYELKLLNDAYLTRLEIDDGRFALLCSLTANIHRDSKKNKKGFSPADFMINRRNPQLPAKGKGKRQSTKQQIEHFKAVTALFGGTIAPRLGSMDAATAAKWLEKNG